MLPAQQEPHEVLRAERLDLAPLAALGVAMDAGQQVAGAPLLVLTQLRVEAAPHGKALSLEAGQADLRPADRQGAAGGQAAHGYRACELKVPANGEGSGDVGVRWGLVLAADVFPTCRREAEVGLEARCREESLGPRASLGGTPQRGPAAVPAPCARPCGNQQLHGPAGAYQLLEPLQPVLPRAMDQG